ncbi:MAG TPA: crosslink repair DNA glycosylase YcaQ family protein, partial [Chloroflexota bacterium]|nr:crosslink repair DNA glycosylase YcaQ family protein [Chloroflexota bacterium]
MTNSPELGEEDLRVLRARAQLLDRTKPGVSPGDIVRRVCGVQAQEISSATLALRARAVGLTSNDVHEARVGERSVVRTWAMRGTLQLLASGDVGWLLPLVASRFLPGARRRLAQLGFRGDALAKAVTLLEKMLTEEEPLTRPEVAERLARRGIGTEGQAAYHLIRLAALEGLVCMGPDRGGESTFVLLRDWLRPQSTLEGEAGLAELAR